MRFCKNYNKVSLRIHPVFRVDRVNARFSEVGRSRSGESECTDILKTALYPDGEGVWVCVVVWRIRIRVVHLLGIKLRYYLRLCEEKNWRDPGNAVSACSFSFPYIQE